MNDIFSLQKLELRRKVFVWWGAKIDITDLASQTNVGFVKMKGWKLREDIRLFSDSTETNELLTIKARQIIDFGATYDVFNPQNQQKLFSLRRKGLKSAFVRDTWFVLDENEQEYAQITEVGTYALLRRYIAIIPYLGWAIELLFFFLKIRYEMYLTAQGNHQHVSTITRQKNPLVIKFQIDNTDGQGTIDSSAPLSTAIMLSIIEASKN